MECEQSLRKLVGRATLSNQPLSSYVISHFLFLFLLFELVAFGELVTFGDG